MVNLNKIVALTVISLFMTACTVSSGLSQPYQASYWYKEGVNQSVTNDKVGYCKTEVGASRLSQEEAKKLVGYCMKADGYRVVTETRNR